MKPKTQILICTGLLILVSGCINYENTEKNISTDKLNQWVGKNVRVQFRRDALGTAAKLPVSPNTRGINGASTTIVGKLMNVEADGIFVESSRIPGSDAKSEKWIPREVILFLENNP